MFKKILQRLHPSWSFYAAVWGIIAGISVAVGLEQIFLTDFWMVLGLTVVILLSLRHSSPLVLALIFLASFLVGNFWVGGEIASRQIVQDYYGETVTLTGKIAEDPDENKIRLQDPTIQIASEGSVLKGVIYVTLSGAPDLERSDTVTLEGKLSAGFGTFIATMYRPKILAVERPDPGDIFAQFKHWFANVVKDFVPSPEVDLGLGYLMGMKSGLSEDFSEALAAVGMTHVVVASGAHLAILTGAAKKIFGKISKFAGLLFSLLMIAAFVLVVGFTPSMTRAALVASLSLLVGYVGRQFTPLRLISFVAMLTLLINPIYLLNLGWQLSFASFFGILVVAPRLTKIFYGGKNPPWLATMLLTSLGTCLVCAPVLIYNFGAVSLLSFVANLVVLPTLPYAMLGMLLTGITSPVSAVASVVARLTTWLLDLHIWLVEFLSEKTAFIINVPAGDARVYLLYAPLLVFLAFPNLQKLYRRWQKDHKTKGSCYNMYYDN